MENDQVTEEQLTHFSEQIRKAVGGAMVLVLATAGPDAPKKAERNTLIGISTDTSRFTTGASTAAFISRRLANCADAVLREMTGGKCYLKLCTPEDPDGSEFQVAVASCELRRARS